MIRYKVKDIAYECDETTGRSRLIIGGIKIEYQNAIECFNSFWGTAGFRMLENLRDKLEENGFDRWTGEVGDDMTCTNSELSS